MAKLKLTLAVEHYDRHLPLLEGLVQPEGIELQAREDAVALIGPHANVRKCVV